MANVPLVLPLPNAIGKGSKTRARTRVRKSCFLQCHGPLGRDALRKLVKLDAIALGEDGVTLHLPRSVDSWRYSVARIGWFRIPLKGDTTLGDIERALRKCGVNSGGPYWGMGEVAHIGSGGGEKAANKDTIRKRYATLKAEGAIWFRDIVFRVFGPEFKGIWALERDLNTLLEPQGIKLKSLKPAEFLSLLQDYAVLNGLWEVELRIIKDCQYPKNRKSLLAKEKRDSGSLQSPCRYVGSDGKVASTLDLTPQREGIKTLPPKGELSKNPPIVDGRGEESFEEVEYLSNPDGLTYVRVGKGG